MTPAAARRRHAVTSPSLRLLLAGGLVSVLSASCAHAPAKDPSYTRPCPAPEGCVTFRVAGPASADQPRDTPVLLVAAAGASSFGTTDSEGILVVPRRALAAPGLSALLFCWDTRSDACTAVRLDSGAVASYDWVNVTLPANRLTRRSQAHPAPHATPIPSP